jgi:hypothetical protein
VLHRGEKKPLFAWPEGNLMTNPTAEASVVKQSRGFGQWVEKASNWLAGRSQPQQGEITLIRAVPRAGARLSPDALRALVAADVIVYGRHVDYDVLAYAVGERSLVYLATPSLEAGAPQIALDYARRGQKVVRLVGIEDAGMPDALSDEALAHAAGIPFSRIV